MIIIIISMETAYYILLFALLYFLTNQIIKKFQNLPPSSPLCLPILGHLHLLKKPLHQTLANISDKYGPILLLYFGSRPVLLVSDPFIVEECFTKNDIVFANRPRFLTGKYLGYNYTTMTWSSYGQHWRNLRKLATLELLSSNRIQLLASKRDDEVRLLIQRLLRISRADEYGTVEMKSVFFEYTMNIIMRMIAGKRYYGDNDEMNRKEAKRFQQLVKESFQVSGAMNIADFVPLVKWMGGQLKLEKKIKKLHMKRDKFMLDLIEEHRKIRASYDCDNVNRNKTLLDVLLSLQEKEPGYYTDELINGMHQIMVSGGTETSSGTMEWALSLLLNNPASLKKAQEEIDSNVGHSRLLNDSDLDQLPYLHALINETLRLYPASSIIVPHASSEDCVVGGYRIPRGTLLLINIWAIQNDPNVWDECEKFKPERFMNSEGQRERFVFMPFGYGRRRCPGENLAMRIVGLTLGSLLQCFDWQRVGDELVNMSTLGSGFHMAKAQSLLAKFKPRQRMIKLLSQL